MHSLAPLINDLAEGQSTFLLAADAIPSDQWMTRPGEEKWSAAEVVAHLVTVETAIVAAANRVTQKPAKRISLWQRRHLPLWLVSARVIRRKSPLAMDTGLVRGKEDLLGELRTARARTLAFLEETKKRDLSAYCWRHAFLGMLNTYEWFEMIARHQVRHAKQMKEIAERLPKPVTTAGNW